MPSSVTCSDCGTELDESFAAVPRKVCPECGSTSRTFSEEMTATVNVTGWIDWEHVHEEWEKRRGLIALAALLTLASVLVGYVVAGTVGLAIGLGVSVAASVVGARAITRVRQIERGTTRPR